jgi:hypothetical protein
MSRMTAADAAVAILRHEGVTDVFGLPGAAINPFYAAMRRDGEIRHTLARHVEGASHMAEGYSRARSGNIGVCVGTSGPAGTDMATGLYSASADSIPIRCITGQADRGRGDAGLTIGRQGGILNTGSEQQRPDLAGRLLGASVVCANDELFADRENLIKPGNPVFQPGGP